MLTLLLATALLSQSDDEPVPERPSVKTAAAALDFLSSKGLVLKKAKLTLAEESNVLEQAHAADLVVAEYRQLLATSNQLFEIEHLIAQNDAAQKELAADKDRAVGMVNN